MDENQNNQEGIRSNQRIPRSPCNHYNEGPEWPYLHKDAFDMVQEAMAISQEAVDNLPKKTVKLAKEYAEDNLTSSRDFSAYA